MSSEGLGDRLNAFGNGVRGEFPRKYEADGSLDFAARDGLAAMDVGQVASFRGDAFEHVFDETVDDVHRHPRDPRGRVVQLEYTEDIGEVVAASLTAPPGGHAGGLLFPGQRPGRPLRRHDVLLPSRAGGPGRSGLRGLLLLLLLLVVGAAWWPALW